MTKGQWFVILTRVGFVARGLVYLAIGVLVIFLGRAEGTDGALRFLSDGVGRWILFVIAVGFAAYSLWRLIDAGFGTEHPGDGRRALRKRVGSAISGIIHLVLAWQTGKLAIGMARASDNPDQTAATVLQLPGGQMLLIGAAVAIAIAGVIQLVRGTSCSFLEHLVPEARRDPVKWLGRLGYAARGVVFLIVGYHLFTAGLDGASWKAGGTEQVFSWLSRPTSLVLAAGLFLFGVYGLVEAWYRHIHTPDFEGLAARASNKVAT